MGTWQRTALVSLISLLLLWLIEWVAGGFHSKPPSESPQPLKVTIIDDGGADLKVESTVKEVRQQ